MATIKSYTGVNQSRKLAEILPLESADMAYTYWKEDNKLMMPFPFILDGSEKEDEVFTHLPCWSLAALLNILPRLVEIEGRLTFLSFYPSKHLGWVIEYSNNKEDFIEFAFCSKNLIDACYEMILKLNKLNLL